MDGWRLGLGEGAKAVPRGFWEIPPALAWVAGAGANAWDRVPPISLDVGKGPKAAYLRILTGFGI